MIIFQRAKKTPRVKELDLGELLKKLKVLVLLHASELVLDDKANVNTRRGGCEL